MSFYSRSASAITTEDLRTFAAAVPVENVRLEFKRTVPKRDEFLKKVSALANTYGGHLVIGVSAASSDGRLQDLPGVDEQSGLKQKLIQWCFDGLWPPLEVEVSDPIPSPSAQEKMCYVVAVPESYQAPHFINGRKGCYIRTDEFSGRFEPQLGTYDDIEHLANRRAETVRRRDSLLSRAKERWEQALSWGVLSRTCPEVPDSTMSLFVSPLFPAASILEQDQLMGRLKSTRANWRQVGFPGVSEPLTQHESVLLLNAAGGCSLLETTVFGSLFYAAGIDGTGDDEPSIHLYRLVGYLLLFLAHAARFLSESGFSGLILVKLALDGFKGVPVHSPQGPRSLIDNHFEFDRQMMVVELMDERDNVARQLLQTILFALNWPDAASDASTKVLINDGYEFNFWQIRGPY